MTTLENGNIPEFRQLVFMIADRQVKNYKSDIEYDYVKLVTNFLSMKDGHDFNKKYLWMLRESGTSINEFNDLNWELLDAIWSNLFSNGNKPNQVFIVEFERFDIDNYNVKFELMGYDYIPNLIVDLEYKYTQQFNALQAI